MAAGAAQELDKSSRKPGAHVRSIGGLIKASRLEVLPEKNQNCDPLLTSQASKGELVVSSCFFLPLASRFLAALVTFVPDLRPRFWDEPFD